MIRRSRAWVSLSIFLLATAGIVLSQKTDEPTQTIKSRTRLVLVSVLAKDGDGHHVSKLSADDFSINDNGIERKIVNFEEVVAIAHKSPETSKREFSNVTPDDAVPSYTIIAIDSNSIDHMALAYTKQEMVKFLQTIHSINDQVAIVLLSDNGMQTLQDFTSDPRVLEAVLRKTKIPDKTPERSKDGDLNNSRPDMYPKDGDERAARALVNWLGLKDTEQVKTNFDRRVGRIHALQALQELAQSLRGLPGRKNVVWVSSGLEFAEGLFTTNYKANASSTQMNIGGITSSTDQSVITWKLLNDANIAVYPVDARGVVNPAFELMGPNVKYSPLEADRDASRRSLQETYNGFEKIAEATGGKPCYGRTDLHNCLQEASQDSRQYYMMGYYLDPSDKPGWHKIKVETKAKNVRLRTRKDFYLTPEDAEHKVSTTLPTVSNSPLDFFQLPIDGRWTTEARVDGKMQAGFALHIPASGAVEEGKNKLMLEFIVIARNAEGKVVVSQGKKVEKDLTPQDMEVIRRSGISYNGMVKLDPGEYKVKFIVLNKLTDAIGSASTILAVGPTTDPVKPN